MLKCTRALVRGVPTSLPLCLKSEQPLEPLNVEKARKQHDDYISLLSSHVSTVFLAADESHPDCCFIEDTAIIVGDTAIICNPGAVDRRGEEVPVREKLLSDLGFPSSRVHSMSSPGTIDGGDVLVIGRDILIGMSNRTNIDAIEQVDKLFSGRYRVTSIPVNRGLHLKSVISLFDTNTIIIAIDEVDGSIGSILRRLGFSLLIVPDRAAANALRVNGSLFVQAGFPASEAILREACKRTGIELVPVCMSELMKADGALTCCSILIE